MVHLAGSRNLFLLGTLMGIAGGFVLGSVAALGARGDLNRLARWVVARITSREPHPHWELLEQ